MKSIDPATGKTIKEYIEHSEHEVDSKLTQAQKAFSSWRTTTFPQRADLMKKAARILQENKVEYANLMTAEMGKLPRGGIAEVEKCVWVCKYYAENAENFLSEDYISTEAGESFICYNPLGTVLAIMPWNFPFWQVFRFAAPALMAGNTVVLKHASNVSGCALAIEEIFQQAGFMKGVFHTLLIGSDKVSTVIKDKRIAAVTLTGSTPAGKAVAAAAGGALKKCVLELGGSDPYLVLEDADLPETVDLCVTSKLINSGQSCIAAKRFIVVEKVLDRFIQLILQMMKAQVMGDPRNPETTLGPMARLDLRDELHQQVQTTIEQGADCLLGGYLPDLAGAYYPATVLTNVKKGMLAYREELFGPVALIISAADQSEAIRIANDSRFGLGAAVFTKDAAKGRKIATDQLEAGCCFVNDFVKSDPRLPFGGIKESGFGRELSSCGIKEFVNIKTVQIADALPRS